VCRMKNYLIISAICDLLIKFWRFLTSKSQYCCLLFGILSKIDALHFSKHFKLTRNKLWHGFDSAAKVTFNVNHRQSKNRLTEKAKKKASKNILNNTLCYSGNRQNHHKSLICSYFFGNCTYDYFQVITMAMNLMEIF
jgi:hypothetical protein